MSNRIILIYPYNNSTIPRMPNAALALAGPLQKAGYDITICDTVTDDYTSIDYSNILFLGISAYSDPRISNAIEIAQFVKNHYPNTPIVWGGPHPSLLSEQTLQSPYCDIVCRGEGEVTAVEIAKALKLKETLHSVKGISWRNRQGDIIHNPSREFIDMDAIELYPFDSVNCDKYYWSTQVRFHYESSRGCPYHCTFCSFDPSRSWRGRSGKRIVDDLEYIQQRFQPKDIQFLDSEFFINTTRVEEFCTEVIERGLKINWLANCRANLAAHYDDSFFQLLKKSGCVQLQYGAESGSNRILESIQKKITREQIIESVTRTKKAGISNYLNFMSGFPGETMKDVYLTLSLIDELKKIDPELEISGMFVYAPYPGSTLYNQTIQMGYTPPKSLEEWGKRTNVSIYETAKSTPWLPKSRRKILHTISAMVRFDYMVQRERHVSFDVKRKLLFNSTLAVILYKIVTVFFILSKTIRWKLRFFTCAFEWKFWTLLRDKFIGY